MSEELQDALSTIKSKADDLRDSLYAFDLNRPFPQCLEQLSVLAGRMSSLKQQIDSWSHLFQQFLLLPRPESLDLTDMQLPQSLSTYVDVTATNELNTANQQFSQTISSIPPSQQLPHLFNRAIDFSSMLEGITQRLNTSSTLPPLLKPELALIEVPFKHSLLDNLDI
ncbi:hypothetical protein P9112_011521 [Eukaryota sp. TZLM1-RC]